MIRYVITDGRHYLKRDANGNYIPTNGKIFGDVYEQRSKAANVLENCVSKNLRNRYHIQEILEDEVENKKVEPVEIKPKENVAKEIGNETFEAGQIDKWANGINSLSSFAQSVEERKKDLVDALSDVDSEISDINHYIEFGKFNAYQGWLAFNMLKNRLKRRRKIKDELYIVSQLGECKINSAMIEEIKSSMSTLDGRIYRPRKLKELFERT